MHVPPPGWCAEATGMHVLPPGWCAEATGMHVPPLGWCAEATGMHALPPWLVCMGYRYACAPPGWCAWAPGMNVPPLLVSMGYWHACPPLAGVQGLLVCTSPSPSRHAEGPVVQGVPVCLGQDFQNYCCTSSPAHSCLSFFPVRRNGPPVVTLRCRPPALTPPPQP